MLPDSVAKRIAAGEVIERPASVVRELIDNALDAGAATVEVEYTGGGIEQIRVVDNGTGMGPEDLAMCLLPHATSKIRSLEDLAHTTSMGFRGEALASMVAVADVEIRSRMSGTDGGHRVFVPPGSPPRVEPAPCPPGTRVDVRRLFSDLPARRRFLSRPQTEAGQIRQALLDKALANESVRFVLSHQGERRLVLQPGSVANRVATVFGDRVPEQALTTLTGSGEGFRYTIAAASPDIARRDRRLIQACVNGRRVWEYKLVHAVENAYGEVLHGGLFPVAALFLDISPDLVDVNVHPAKREVRIRTIAEIHHAITETLRSFLRAYLVQTVVVEREFSFPATHARDRRREAGTLTDASFSPAAPVTPPAGRTGPRPAFFSDTERRAVAETPGPHRPDEDGLRYVGHLFDTFLIAADRERAYVIDHHAAHERILYDRLRDARAKQKLLIEEEFETTPEEDRALRNHRDEFEELGVVLERGDQGGWRLVAAPAEYRENAQEMIETIRELGGIQGAWDREFLARLACKAAVKAGTLLDAGTSLELARHTLALPEPRCPHGRPLWVELDREALLRLIGRI